MPSYSLFSHISIYYKFTVCLFLPFFEFPHLFCVVGPKLENIIRALQNGKAIGPNVGVCEPCEDDNRANLRCKLCGMEMFGGITCLKYHLAKILGHDVNICPIATPNIVLIAKNTILHTTRKRD